MRAAKQSREMALQRDGTAESISLLKSRPGYYEKRVPRETARSRKDSAG